MHNQENGIPPEHPRASTRMSSGFSVYSETWWGRISLTKRYNDFHFHWKPKYLCVYNLEKLLSLADNKFTGCRIEKKTKNNQLYGRHNFGLKTAENR